MLVKLAPGWPLSCSERESTFCKEVTSAAQPFGGRFCDDRCLENMFGKTSPWQLYRTWRLTRSIATACAHRARCRSQAVPLFCHLQCITRGGCCAGEHLLCKPIKPCRDLQRTARRALMPLASAQAQGLLPCLCSCCQARVLQVFPIPAYGRVHLMQGPLLPFAATLLTRSQKSSASLVADETTSRFRNTSRIHLPWV